MSKEGWTTVTLGDIAENISVRVDDPSKSGLDRFVGLEHLDSGNMTVIRWGSTNEFSSGKRFESGDVLLCRRRPYLRKCSATDFDGVCSGDAYVLREKPDAIVPGLLKYILNTERFWNYCITNADGSMSSRVKWKSLEQFPILLKDFEQQGIDLKILDSVSGLKDKYVQIQINAAKLMLYYYSDLINELVDNLPSTILGNCISEKITSGHSPAATKEDTGHSLLTLSALSKYGFLNGREKPTQNIQEVRRYTIRKGDVLISRSNTRELVGLAGVVEEDSDNLSFPDLMFRVRVDQSKLLPYFLEVILLSNIGRRYMMSNAQGTSGSMKKINTKMLVSMPIPIVPIQEQRKISDIRVLLKQSFDFLNEGPSSPIESMLGVMRMTLAQLFPEAN